MIWTTGQGKMYFTKVNLICKFYRKKSLTNDCQKVWINKLLRKTEVLTSRVAN